MNGVVKKLDIEKINHEFNSAKPFPHVVIDDFFDISLLKAVKEDFPDYNSEEWFRFRNKIGKHKNIFESGMNAISKPESMPNLCRLFLHNLNSKKFSKILESITGIKNIEPDPHWHYTGLRVNTPGSHQLIHSDALFHPHLKKRKILTCMTYMTEDWKESDEGCLEIWDDSMEKCVNKIEPIFNRVVIFKNTEYSYHGVTKNNHYRKAITMSYLVNETDEKRWRALFVKRPEDNKLKNFDEIAEHRAKLNDTK